ncbi:hypothetical protein INT44_000399 [Umbelopsis vinacea]|uniref:TauD/TfdA-like domain-containing protein n=1 Tax=Umbelopsis vinacea TaxID=44442 RepID=A0A8H7PMH7_9FUNG|nr:hypothetical protein INT44_000399 [Umbelopsis vinacea]
MVANSDTITATTDKIVNKSAPLKPASSLPIVNIDDPQYPHYQEDVKYPPIEEFEHVDRGHKADPKKAALLGAASEIIELTPHIGTEIHGVQLNQLTDQQKDELALLVAERGVVFFRDQEINIHEQLALGRYYGPLHIHPTSGQPKDIPEAHVVLLDGEKTKRQEYIVGRSNSDLWHTDVSYERQPPGLTTLKIDTLPPVGGDTLWASSYLAYERLSPPIQKLLEGLEAVHSAKEQADASARFGGPVRREPVEHTHPIIRTHPVTKRKALYVNPVFTRRIVGLSHRESDTLLRLLYDHIAGGYDFTVRFKWQKNSVAVWDNRVTVHNAIFDYLTIGRRHGLRVTPQAEKPYLEKTE